MSAIDGISERVDIFRKRRWRQFRNRCHLKKGTMVKFVKEALVNLRAEECDIKEAEQAASLAKIEEDNRAKRTSLDSFPSSSDDEDQA